ncbi:hypothetical protein EYR36_012039 [Pleurotus pulmonarius]|nr:hypothetical protein EYR36_012039 [Pleurotus pulmonarius]
MDYYKSMDEQISRFCEKIREKPSWPFKVLDESKELMIKWAMEAQLLGSEDEMKDDNLPVVQAIRDLEAEARRIVALDYELRLGVQEPPQEGVSFDKIDYNVTNALKFARQSKYYITRPQLKEELGVFVTDDLVPVSLQSELLRSLDVLAQKEPKDMHPGSRGKVQDLIHPSLYPYKGAISQVHPGVTLPRLDDGVFRTKQSTLTDYTFESRYAWIPSIFHISEDGLDVSIKSYINGLGPRERYPDLYRLIEKLEEKEAQEEGEAKRRADFVEQQAREIGRIPEFHSLDRSAAAVPEKYRGKDLKVIVKAANYVLKPGQEYVGTWHMEGMPHEQIVASAIYYYQADPEIHDQGLSFRRRRDNDSDFPSNELYMHHDFDIDFVKDGAKVGDGEEEEEDEDEEDEDEDADDSEPEHDYPSDWEYTEYHGERQPRSTSDLPIFTDLGTVPATGVVTKSNQPTGRIITFPNWIQHKVGGISHSVSDPAAPALPATRRILCFFLVDENQTDGIDNDTAFYHGYVTSGLAGMNVLSSLDVPWQARPCNIATLHLLLSIAWKRLVGKDIPAELRNYIIAAAIEGTITREEAEKWRRELMVDRKIKGTSYRETRFWDGSYSLCEH